MKARSGIWALFCVAVFVGAAAAMVEPEIFTDEAFGEWEAWKLEHGRQYRTRSEHDSRFTTFARNRAAINEWNRRVHAAAAITGDEDAVVLSMNRFGDLSEDEFRMLLGLNVTAPIDEVVVGNEFEVVVNDAAEPELMAGITVDFRKRGAVAPVLNQGSCGGCWAYAVAGACEGARAFKGRGLVQLSPQQLIDCSRESPNAGCNGGDPRVAMQHVINHGLERLSDYPTTPRQGSCRYSSSRVAARFTGMVRVPYGNEAALARALVLHGPLSVAMDASTFAFQFYHSGIFRDPACSPTRLNHAMVLVGFTPYSWIIKNSWGSDWGMNGFVEVARNRNNMCGVATYAIGAISA